MAFNLKKLSENEFEYISSKGKRSVFTRENLITFVSRGKEILVDGVKFDPSSNTSGQPVTEAKSSIQSASEEKIHDFKKLEDNLYSFNGRNVTKAVILNNLKKGVKISVDKKQIKLTPDGTDYVFINEETVSKKHEELESSSFSVDRKNLESIVSSTTAVTNNPIITINVTQDEAGNFFYKNEQVEKERILTTLHHGKHVSINGKLIELTEDKEDFKLVEEPKPVPAPKQAEAVKLIKESHELFFYPKLGKKIKRIVVINNLKKGVKIEINDKEVFLTPDRSDFGYRDEIDQLLKGLKTKDQINKELGSDKAIIETSRPLPTYFGNEDTLVDSVEAATSPADQTESYQHLKGLQRRLFYYLSDSNLVNVNSEKSSGAFDLVTYINEFEKSQKESKIFNKLLTDESYVFNFKQTNAAGKNLWNQINKFNSIVEDKYKEFGDDYLYLGYPSVSDVIVDIGNKNDKPVFINAPIFLIKTKLIVDNKNKAFNLSLGTENQQVAFRINKELLIYLIVKLNKNISLLKHNRLFDDEFKSYKEQIVLLDAFFKDLQIAFDAKKLENYINVFSSSEFDGDTSDLSAAKSTKTITKTSALSIKDNCFLGIFRTQNSDIYKDYDKILATQEGKDFWSTLDNMFPDQLNYYVNKGQEFNESEIKQIVDLDYSQKTACKLALDNSINIVGPAGTGKSQTISNILANFIDRHKSALFVAEKKTATDVVFNRLKNLRYYCLPLFDKDNWNEVLTKQLKITLRRVGQLYGQWEALELDKKENREDKASFSLDRNFAKIKEYRRIMSTDEGYSLAKETINFAAPNLKQLQKDIDTLVPTIFAASGTSEEFWKQINAGKIEKSLYKECKALIESIDYAEIKGSVDLQNKFLKCCKYYDSPTLYDNEMIQILSGDLPDDEAPLKSLKQDADKVKAFQTRAIYKAFQRNLKAKRASMPSTLQLIKKADRFITVEYLKSLEAKINNREIIAANGASQTLREIDGKVYVVTENGGLVPFTGTANGQAPQGDPIQAFADLYNDKSFNFDKVKKFYDLTTDFTQKNSNLLDLKFDEWFDETHNDLTNKMSSDLQCAEISFLEYVRNEIKANPIYALQYNKLYGEVDNCTKLKNVDQVFQKYGNIIALLYPIVIASPNLVSKHINPIAKMFDHVVIDEASMLSLEKAIPILFRGKKYCIVGDSKQLKPLSYLDQLNKLGEFKKLLAKKQITPDDYDKQVKLVNTYQGVLDFISPKIQKTTLQYHYRAVKTELVKFSSVVYYDNEMIATDNYKNKNLFTHCGLVVNQINGSYENGINKEECNALYHELEQIAKLNKTITDVSKKISVGIIVFTPEQKEYLNNLIATKANPDIINMNYMLNTNTGEDESLFIRDIQEIQGSERDIILASLGTSSKNKAEIIKSLGLINTQLGNNFLNVFTTRQRQSLIIFKSFVADDLPNINSESVNCYKDFIKYIDLLSSKDKKDVASEVDNLLKPYILASATIDYSTLALNSNKKYLAQLLFKHFTSHIDNKKYDIVFNYEPIKNHSFGLVALDKTTKIPEFAILFDDFIKNMSTTAKQSEFYDFLFLNSRGWKFSKVSALEWANELFASSEMDKNEKDPFNQPKVQATMNDFIKKKLTFGTKCYYVDHVEHPETLAKPQDEEEQIYYQVNHELDPALKEQTKKQSKKPSKKIMKNKK